MITRSTPHDRIALACQTVAAVIAQAPSRICRLNMAGDMVVLPCGAHDTPRRLQYASSVLLLCSIADANITAIGYGTSESKMLQPVRPTAAAGKPFGVRLPGRVESAPDRCPGGVTARPFRSRTCPRR